MNKLKEFQSGDGAHNGLWDWYPEKEAALKAALDAHQPFDTGWYSSKKEIASARIRSEDGIKIKVDVSVSDDFDTEGVGYRSTQGWTLLDISDAIDKAWAEAEAAQADNQPFEGFSIGRDGRWEETYLWGDGTYDTPPGDNYHWWGWQHDETEEGSGVGVPDPAIPLPTVAAFENWVQRWVMGEAEGNSMTLGAWTITAWRKAPREYEDPNDYVGMGWVDSRGRP